MVQKANKPIYLLFDVDDTLTRPKTEIDEEMIELLTKLKSFCSMSAVGGGTYNHIYSQIQSVSSLFDFIFGENGTTVYKENQLLEKLSIVESIGNNNINKLNNFLLKYMSKLDLPFKRGTFIELRNGLINISPPGRNVTLEERDLFDEYNKKHHVLQTFKRAIDEEIKNMNLVCSYGGKISLDLYPKGWDKSICLRYLDFETYDIYFFGDKIYEGGNDLSIAIDKRVAKYYSVKGINDTKSILKGILSELENNH